MMAYNKNALVPGGSFLGCRIRTKREFSGVPVWTEGVIDEEYSVGTAGHGVMIAWDLPSRPLPKGYRIYDGKPAFASGILRDGFSAGELEYLELVEDPRP